MTPLDAAQTVAAILAVLVSAYAGWAGARKSLADAKATADPRTPYEALERRTLHLEEADAEKSKQINQLRSENTYLSADVADLQNRLGAVEDDRDTLARAVSAHVEWEDAGRPDPPGAPTIAEHVRATLTRLRAD